MAPTNLPTPPPTLSVAVERLPGATLITVEGELDLDGAPGLCAAIQAGRRPASPDQVLVDLTAVGFCDSTGLRALMDAAREVAISGGRLVAIVPEDGPVRRVIAMTGAEEFLAVTSDRDQLLAAFENRERRRSGTTLFGRNRRCSALNRSPV